MGNKEFIVKLRDLLILASGVAAASQVSALSLGNTQGNVQLGSPIDLVFQVMPDAGQTADSSCIAADVWMGDAAISRAQISLTPQGNAIRLRTSTPVYEPLITVKLHAGCAGAIARSYTFFADPPHTLAASTTPIDLSKIQVSPVPAATAAAVARAAPEKKPRAPKRVVTPAANKPKVVAAASAATATASAPSAERAAAPADTSAAAPLPVAAAVNTSEDKPRLRVEPIEGLDAPSSAVPATSATTENLPSSSIDAQTQLVLDANAARLEAMEKQLQTLQSQLTNNRSEIISLQTQLVQAQNQDLPLWVHIMLGMLALALATIAWLLQRIKQERMNAQRSWADTVLAVDDSVQATSIDTRSSTAVTPQAAAAAATPSAAEQPGPFEASIASAASKPAPQSWSSAEAPSPTVMPEELYAEFEQLAGHKPSPEASPSIAEVLTAQALFDVQEQAEFYASIGENDQAIEILQTHIAEHQASSPLAYIELLQLLYRLSRTETFEQVREQFQAHFNVKVPDFLGFSRKGYDLWSGHPEVLSKIEALWPTDEVQTLLRDLIVRKSAADHRESDMRFDLSAFDDLLMLYNVAQTTPASSRGQLPGRVRTAPTEVPLPEVVFDNVPAPTSYPARTAATAAADHTPLSLSAANLDMLSAAPAQAPLAPPNPHNDSPFQSTAHFAPDEILMDGLTLNWEATTSTPPSTEKTDTASAEVKLQSLEDELNPFIMDERDLPPIKK